MKVLYSVYQMNISSKRLHMQVDIDNHTLQETCHLATAETVGKGLKSRRYRS